MNKKPGLNCLLLGAACMVGSAFAMNDDMNRQKASPPSKQDTTAPAQKQQDQNAENAASEKAREQEQQKQKREEQDRKY